jgi:hypothetical protein
MTGSLSPPYATALSRKMTVLLASLPSTLLNALKRRNRGLPRLPKAYCSTVRKARSDVVWVS